MGAEEYTWGPKSRLCVVFKTSDDSSTTVHPITSMDFTGDMPSDPINSIDGCNLGWSDQNPKFTFNMEVQAINFAVFRKLFTLGLNRGEFSIVLQQLDTTSDDWFLDSILFERCKVTNFNESQDNTNKIPPLKFQCGCLEINASNNGESIVTDKVGGATGSLT